MIRVTPTAAAQLRRFARHGRPSAAPVPTIRLAPDGKGGLSMEVGLARPGDLVAADAAGPVLVIDAALATPLDGLAFAWRAGALLRDDPVGFTFRPAAAEEPAGLIVAAPPS